MYRTILVPFDGSALSAQAIPLAAELARRSGAALHLAIVHDPSAYIPFVAGEVAVPTYDPAIEREQRADARARLDEQVAALQRQGCTATGMLLEGMVVDALATHAHDINADLVVLTTHGRGGFTRVRLGSVTTALLPKLVAPALVVRVDDDAPVPVLHSGPVLCALDATLFAEAALPHAQTFASVIGSRLHLVGVTVPHAVGMAPFAAEAMLADEAALTTEAYGRSDYLERARKLLPEGTTTSSVTDMSVSKALIDELERIDGAAIALATHGRSGFARFMLGSTTDEVIRNAPRPVLVVRALTDDEH